MSFKITSNLQQRLWLKKIISKSLAIGLLFNSGLTSFAGILSEDGRYETFEGNNITINNILEEDKIDIEVEGNTLVNLVKRPSVLQKTATTTGNAMLIGIENKQGSVSIKPNTVYTFYVEYYVKEASNNCATYIEGQFNLADGSYQWFSKGNLSDSSTGHKKGLFYVHSSEIAKSLNYFYIGIHSQNGEDATATVEMNNILLLEGKYLEDEIPSEYFEGMKSVGELEDNKLNIEVLGENLFDIDYFKQMIETHYDEENYGYEIKDGKNAVWVVRNHHNLLNKNVLSNNYKFKKNTKYIIKYNIFVDENNPDYHGLRGNINYTDGTSSSFFTTNNRGTWVSRVDISLSAKTVENLIFNYGSQNSKVWFDLDSIYIGEYNLDKAEFNYNYNVQNLEIELKEPLRGLPNGVKDRIIKRNGQWVVERNYNELILDGSENWTGFKDSSTGVENGIYGSISYASLVLNDLYVNRNENTVLSDRFISIKGNDYNYNQESIYAWDRHLEGSVYPCLYIHIDNDKLENNTLNEYKKYLSQNPVKVIYQLREPIYEPIKVNLSVQLFENITHIYNNSTIPANIKVTVDRTINRAIEAIELAKINPTIENLSKARMWSNLLKESIIKDELNNEISGITNIEDLQIEKKTVSANVDLYIKSQNSLSMSVSTNSVIFEDFTGVDDMEKLNAINITINSSLPYQLNSYLVDEIKNVDNSSIINKELFNIRLNGEDEYKGFNNINEKLILKDNCIEGNHNQFGIDLILKGSQAHKADVYKTVIKFEAEQK